MGGPTGNLIELEDGTSYTIDDKSGTRVWWADGEPHREDGPAIEYSDGSCQWWLNGELHRLYGPAIEFTEEFLNSIDVIHAKNSWWFYGKQMPKDEIEKWVIENEVDLSTDEGKVALKLRWM